MKKVILLLSFVFAFGVSYAATPQTNDREPYEIYELYPTQNMWTFLKLNTETGQIWQVQYYVGNDYSKRCQVPLNLTPLATEKKPGRFCLKETQNMYNFLLLDKETGDVWQIQWSMESEKRGIVDEIRKIY